MAQFTQELIRLQKLSCIALSPEEEKKFWTQLNDIIWFLGQLPDTKGNIDLKTKANNISLRTIEGVKEDQNGKKLMKNVKHEVVNNSIVIKSVLS
jgi:Asp-tRNA(Asn)/Glu-tRNA(Gln) amidotransferase C subunit